MVLGRRVETERDLVVGRMIITKCYPQCPAPVVTKLLLYVSHMTVTMADVSDH